MSAFWGKATCWVSFSATIFLGVEELAVHAASALLPWFRVFGDFWKELFVRSQP